METRKTNPRRPTIALIIVFILLASCSKTAQQNPTFSSPTSTITSQFTKTPRPTATLRPTRTPTPITPSPTLEPTWEAILKSDAFLSSQTQIAKQTLESELGIELCYAPVLSPNGIMVACAKENQIIVYDKNKNADITIGIKDFLPDTPDADLIFPSIFQWSNDNAYLYFTINACCHDGPSFLNTHNGLYRLNISARTISTIVKESAQFNIHYYFSMSPAGKRLIFMDQLQEPIHIGIKNLHNGEIQKIKLDEKFIRAGRILWSADGTQFVFVGLSGDDFYPTPFSFTSLIWVNAITLETKVLIDETSYILTPINWESNNTIVIRSEIETIDTPLIGTYWYYNLNEHQLVTPTAYP